MRPSCPFLAPPGKRGTETPKAERGPVAHHQSPAPRFSATIALLWAGRLRCQAGQERSETGSFRGAGLIPGIKVRLV
jgi:hypothetical protein